MKEKFQRHKCIVLKPVFESGILRRRLGESLDANSSLLTIAASKLQTKQFGESVGEVTITTWVQY